MTRVASMGSGSPPSHRSGGSARPFERERRLTGAFGERDGVRPRSPLSGVRRRGDPARWVALVARFDVATFDPGHDPSTLGRQGLDPLIGSVVTVYRFDRTSSD